MKRRRKDRRERGKKEKGREEGERNIIMHINATSMHWTKSMASMLLNITGLSSPGAQKSEEKYINIYK